MHYSNALCLIMTKILMHMTALIILQAIIFKEDINHGQRKWLKHMMLMLNYIHILLWQHLVTDVIQILILIRWKDHHVSLKKSRQRGYKTLDFEYVKGDMYTSNSWESFKFQSIQIWSSASFYVISNCWHQVTIKCRMMKMSLLTLLYKCITPHTSNYWTHAVPD